MPSIITFVFLITIVKENISLFTDTLLTTLIEIKKKSILLIDGHRTLHLAMMNKLVRMEEEVDKLFNH